jgi:hypothetical protein
MAMKALKLAATLLSTLMLAVIGATSAEAATPITHQTLVTGFEFQASSTQGSFAGTATPGPVNGLSGAWSIVVYHTPLGGNRCGDPQYPCAQITSDASHQSSFMLTVISPAPSVVTGTFVNQSLGTPGIVQVGADTTCGTQHYHINDGLEGIGTVGSQHLGTGSFDADLYHYRYWFFGRCITYSAIVKGTVALTY